MANTRASPKGRVNKICDQCGETYSVIFSRKDIARFCSRKCCSKWQTGEKHPKWKGKIECICLQCGKKFKVYPSDIKQGKGKFCSKECHNEAGRIKRICKYCGKEFSVHANVVIKKGHGIFCSNDCKSKWMSENWKGKSMSHARKGKKEKPTKPERIFQEICERNNLDFHYVGDGQLWIGKKGKKQLNPDFIEANGKKICVEIMGAWWHSRLLNQKVREDALLPFREKHYKKFKWIPIFIWDTDLLRKDAEQFVLSELRRNRVLHE